jgi:hypothetical protein
LMYENPVFSLSMVSSLSVSIGFAGFKWAMALIIDQSCMSSDMESILNSPLRICWEDSSNSKGLMRSTTGPVAKGVSVAWDKCSLPFFISASKIACHSTRAVQVVFLTLRGLSGVQSSSNGSSLRSSDPVS